MSRFLVTAGMFANELKPRLSIFMILKQGTKVKKNSVFSYILKKTALFQEKNAEKLHNIKKRYIFAAEWAEKKWFFTIQYVYLLKINLIMNKTEFIGAVAKNADLSKVSAKKAVDAFIQEVENALTEGKKVTLLGFGTFSIAEKAARMGVNPKTKESINIPARKVVKFKPGAVLAKVAK